MPYDPKKPSFVVADIQSLVIEGLRSLLKEKYEYGGNAGSKYELRKILANELPEILIIDHNTMDLDNQEDLKSLKKDFPGTRIVILSADFTQKELMAFKRAGVNNILDKNAESDEIVRCIDAGLMGKKYFSESVLYLMMEINEQNGFPHENVELTASEKEIIILIGGGLTTKEIALKRSVSFHTIMTHRKNIFRKTGVSNVSELIIYAVKAGIIGVLDYQI